MGGKISKHGFITKDHFGGNFIFDRYDLSLKFASKLKELGVSHLRYPGGTITERQFDPVNPNATISQSGASLVPLSDFLSFVARNELTASIVLPTDFINNSYAEWYSLKQLQDYLENIRFLIQYLINEENGQKVVETIEIGNEYYDISLNAVGYGKIAGLVSDIIVDEYRIAVDQNDFSIEDVPKIAVQAGHKSWENPIILREFQSTSIHDHADELILHDYPWNIDDIDRRDWRYDLIDDWRAVPALRNIELNVSEWNIGSPRGVDGMLQASTLLHHFASMIGRGVQKASVWPILQNTQNDLSGNTPESDLTAAGAVFQFLSHSTINTHYVGAEYINDELIKYHFINDNKDVIFLASHSSNYFELTPSEISIKFDNTPYVINSISGKEGDDISDLISPSFKPDIKSVSNYSKIYMDDIVISPYSIHQIISYKNIHEIKIDTIKFDNTHDSFLFRDHLIGTHYDDRIVTHSGSDSVQGLYGNDLVESGAHRDYVWGGDGADIIFGNGGADILHGNSGDDEIFGGLGRDRIHGGSGDDKLYGGKGDDVLYGGSGDDLIYGGSGNDLIYGMKGNDILFGGTGNDEFIFSNLSGFDKIMDYNPLEDTIKASLLDKVLFKNSYTDGTVNIHIDDKTILVYTSIEIKLINFEFI